MIWLTVILFILTTLFSIYAAPIREWLSKKYSSNKIVSNIQSLPKAKGFYK